MRYLFTALGVLFLLAAIYMATAYFCFRKAARRGKEANIDKFLAAKQFDGYCEELSAAIAYVRLLPHEDAYITSGDGLRLHAKVFRAENERAAVLLFHGYRSDYGYFDFGAVIRKYLEKGISLLLVDQRSHGKSEGKYIGFGIKERGDCLLWAAEATRIFAGLPLVLEGLSMGATTVLMASGDDLPPEVKGIIADCGFTSPKAILSEVIRADYHLPPQQRELAIVPSFRRLRPLADRNIVLLGSFDGLYLKNLREILNALGASVAYHVTAASDMVIVGTADASVCDGADLQLAISMKNAGKNIYILKEDVFCQSVLGKGWLRILG